MLDKVFIKNLIKYKVKAIYFALPPYTRFIILN
jgi:hypothetical protein